MKFVIACLLSLTSFAAQADITNVFFDMQGDARDASLRQCLQRILRSETSFKSIWSRQTSPVLAAGVDYFFYVKGSDPTNGQNYVLEFLGSDGSEDKCRMEQEVLYCPSIESTAALYLNRNGQRTKAADVDVSACATFLKRAL